MALNHLVFTDHGTFRVKADKMTPTNDMLSLYVEGKLVATFSKERVIGVGIERHMPDYYGAKLSVVGEAHLEEPETETSDAAPTPKQAASDDPDNDYLPKKSQ